MINNNNNKLNKIIEEQTLNLFKIGCEPKNYNILQNLLKGKKEMKMFKIESKLSNMPANRRINMLSNVGLINRINNKTEFIITPLGKTFLKQIELIKKQIYITL